MFHGKIRITFALILLGMFYEHGISEIVAWPRIQRHLNKYVKNNLLYAIKPTSVYTCAEVCIQTTLCRYFNFIMDEQLCEIHYAGTVKNRNSSFYVEAASIPSVSTYYLLEKMLVWQILNSTIISFDKYCIFRNQ